jgi:hypothetical protein
MVASTVPHCTNRVVYAAAEPTEPWIAQSLPDALVSAGVLHDSAQFMFPIIVSAPIQDLRNPLNDSRP